MARLFRGLATVMLFSGAAAVGVAADADEATTSLRNLAAEMGGVNLHGGRAAAERSDRER